MLNLDTDTVVYTYNPDEPLPMASMTKIMTYIIAYESIPDLENTVITVAPERGDRAFGHRQLPGRGAGGGGAHRPTPCCT